MRVCRVLMLVLMSLLGKTLYAETSASASFYRNFWYPNYHGQRLAYCTKDDKNCGAYVAKAYCNMLNYKTSSHHVIAHNVGLTSYLNRQGQCKGWQCNGFKLITCQGQLDQKPPHAYSYRTMDFVFPQYEHHRVDWCYESGKHCGRRAAYSFCRRMGYSSASAYEKQAEVYATKSLGDNQVCFGKTCQGFSRIRCYR